VMLCRDDELTHLTWECDTCYSIYDGDDLRLASQLDSLRNAQNVFLRECSKAEAGSVGIRNVNDNIAQECMFRVCGLIGTRSWVVHAWLHVLLLQRALSLHQGRWRRLVRYDTAFANSHEMARWLLRGLRWQLAWLRQMNLEQRHAPILIMQVCYPLLTYSHIKAETLTLLKQASLFSAEAYSVDSNYYKLACYMLAEATTDEATTAEAVPPPAPELLNTETGKPDLDAAYEKLMKYSLEERVSSPTQIRTFVLHEVGGGGGGSSSSRPLSLDKQ